MSRVALDLLGGDHAPESVVDGALLVDDADVTPQWVVEVVQPLVLDPTRLAAMGAAAAAVGERGADELLADMVVAAAGRRSAAAVTAAVGTAPGLAAVSSDAREALIAELEDGACVTDALVAVVGSVNRLTAAALVRGLGEC